MYAPHTVTVFNVGEENMVTFEQPVYATILTGVLLDASKAVNVRASGLEGADSVNLYIPFSVDATDAVTGRRRQYADPKVYEQTDDVSGLWTLKTSDCFFVKGALNEVADFSTINKKYDDVYRVTKGIQRDLRD